MEMDFGAMAREIRGEGFLHREGLFQVYVTAYSAATDTYTVALSNEAGAPSAPGVKSLVSLQINQPAWIYELGNGDGLLMGQSTPTGAIMMFYGATPPSGWLICNGQSTSGFAALAALVGANVPDLRDRLPIGVSGSKALGGTYTHTHSLSASGTATAEDDQHTHTWGGTTSDESVNHEHNYNDYTGDEPANASFVEGRTTAGITRNHQHTLSGTSSGRSHVHDHPVSVSGTSGNGDTVVALHFIIKI